MKYLNNILYIEFQEAILAGIPLGTLLSANYRGSDCWEIIQDPIDNRKRLIKFDILKDQHKNLIIGKFGDPYKYIASSIIKQHLTTPQADYEFLHSYLIPDGSNLPVAKQDEYLKACSYLSLLSTATCKSIRAIGFKSVTEFYRSVIALITNEKVSLPTAYGRLKAKVRAYKEQGAACVISKKFCNDNSKKVKDEISEAVLLEMISHANQFEDVFVARKYNLWAAQVGYKTITDVTVGNYRRRNLVLVTANRDGLKPWQDGFGKVIKRSRPSCPLALINGDDNDLDLFFKVEKTNYKRVTLYVIIDAFNDYPLGYSIDWNQTANSVHAAFLNAIHHIHELTGEYAWWHQLQTDRWALKSLNNFYKAIDPVTQDALVKFTPAKAGNSRSKPIERSFGKDWQSKLRVYDNHSGFNITAVTKKNQDIIRARAKNFPEISEAASQIEHFINRVRTEINERTGISKQEQWLQAYRAMPVEHKRLITDSQRMLHYGYKHTHNNTITNAGINITLQGEKLSYDVAKEDYIKHIGKKMQVMYDPYDLTQVLVVNEDGRTQLLCPAYEKTKMALLDFAPGDRARLNLLLNEQKEIGQMVFDKSNRRKDLLAQKRIDADSLLMSGVLVKEEKHLAESNYYDALNENKADVEHELEDEQDDIFDKQIKAGRKAV